MQRLFAIEVQRIIDEMGEEYARKYMRTLCEVMLDDPSVDAYTKIKLRGVLEFLDETVCN